LAQYFEALRYNPKGSIPDGLTGIFLLKNPASHAVASTKISARNIFWMVKAADV